VGLQLQIQILDSDRFLNLKILKNGLTVLTQRRPRLSITIAEKGNTTCPAQHHTTASDKVQARSVIASPMTSSSSSSSSSSPSRDHHHHMIIVIT
jgi:hypothetical protein